MVIRLIFLSLIILLGCTEDKKPSLVDSKDLYNHESTTTNQNSKEQEINLASDTSFYQKYIFKEKNTVLENNSNQFFLERFNPKETIKKTIINDKDSVVHLCFVFNDSIVKKNAFYNYLDQKKNIKYNDTTKTEGIFELCLISEKSLNIFRGNFVETQLKKDKNLIYKIQDFCNNPSVVIYFREEKTEWITIE